MTRKLTTLLIIITSITAFMVSSAAAGDKIIKASGILTSVESDGTVLIDDRGYYVDSSARILDSSGKKIRLDDLKLPERVQYQFIYEQNGPIITFIRLIAH